METEKAMKEVALRKESVDRNVIAPNSREEPLVALRKESVDRNAKLVQAVLDADRRSP